jgi:hypothetical protein
MGRTGGGGQGLIRLKAFRAENYGLPEHNEFKGDVCTRDAHWIRHHRSRFGNSFICGSPFLDRSIAAKGGTIRKFAKKPFPAVWLYMRGLIIDSE